MNNVLEKEINFKEQDYKGKIESIRGQVKEQAKIAINEYNRGQIDEKELDRALHTLTDQANAQRRDILQERQQAIDETLLAFDRNLAGVQKEDIHHVRIFREGLQDLKQIGLESKDKLISHYKESLKLGDELSLRCAALAGLEFGISEIVNDFAERDKDFAETYSQKKEFENRYRNVEAKAMDMLGDYRTIEKPRLNAEPVKIGQTVTGLPFIKNRLKLK